MNKQAKIGALLVFFVVLTLIFTFWIKGNPFQRTMTLHVLFENVHGVSTGSIVEYAGLECGKVTDFTVTPRGVLTTLTINNPQVKIFEGDQFLIIPSSTIASEYEIFVVPGTQPTPEVPNNATIIGQTPPGIQDFLFEAEKTLNQIQKILGTLDTSLTNIAPVFDKVGKLARSGTIEEITNNIDESTKSIRELTSSTNRLFKRNDSKLQVAIDSISSASSKADKVFSSIDPSEVKQTLSSVRQSSQNIEAITGSVEPDEIRKDLKTFSDVAVQLKQISEKIQSPDPRQDVPSLLKTTLQQANEITAGFASALNGKTLFKGLFTKMKIQPVKQETSPSLLGNDEMDSYLKEAQQETEVTKPSAKVGNKNAIAEPKEK